MSLFCQSPSGNTLKDTKTHEMAQSKSLIYHLKIVDLSIVM